MAHDFSTFQFPADEEGGGKERETERQRDLLAGDADDGAELGSEVELCRWFEVSGTHTHTQQETERDFGGREGEGRSGTRPQREALPSAQHAQLYNAAVHVTKEDAVSSYPGSHLPRGDC